MNQTISSSLKAIGIRIYAIYLISKIGYARLLDKKIVFIFGTPSHRNIGDLAIACAELEFVKYRIDRTVIINIPFPVIIKEKDIIYRAVTDSDIITGHGGGNMGDTYTIEEKCRRDFIKHFKNNKIIIFPQTIHFSNSKIGKNELAKTILIYGQHSNLTLIAREQISYEKMKNAFTTNKVILTPDIVLSMNISRAKNERRGILICLRDDIESKLDKNNKREVILFAKQNFSKVKCTDTISKDKLFLIRPKHRIVNQKLNEFKSSNLVITDRLHGMVFSAITGTPCIAITNFNHKVTGTYEWIKHLPYIKFCDDISKLDILLGQINLDSNYSYNPDDFNEYWKEISDAIEGSSKNVGRN